MDKKFDELLKEILENPDKLLDSSITNDQILEIQKRISPYVGIANDTHNVNDKKKVIAASYTNLREDYIQRFTMTSLVGFLFQLLHEWEVPANKRKWIPSNIESIPTKQKEPFNPIELAERLKQLSDFANTCVEGYKNAEVSIRNANAAELVKDYDKQREETERAVHLESNSTWLLYMITQELNLLGKSAHNKLQQTLKLGSSNPLIKDMMHRYASPDAPEVVEMPDNKAKDIIYDFLKHWLNFDPSIHVRSGYKPELFKKSIEDLQPNIPTEKLHTVFKCPDILPHHREAMDYINKSQYNRSVAAAAIRDDDLADVIKYAIQHADEFKKYLLTVPPNSDTKFATEIIPPQDTFHRWRYYNSVNYEEIRTITEILYPERPDLDWAIALWKVFEGTQEEVNIEFDKYCQRYQEEMPSSIKALEMGAWSILGDFKENRKNMQFYNKNTEVIKRILDRHTEDSKIGAELMYNRVRTLKAKDIELNGPDAEELSNYQQSATNNAATAGATKVISKIEMMRLEKAKGNIKIAKELEHLELLESILEKYKNKKPENEDEHLEFMYAKENINRAREMAIVPEDAVQIDCFTSNPATGEFTRSVIYTATDEKAVSLENL